jgi:prevent-host-death family protein
MREHVVGARELKARLGTYLRRVREGRTLVVTDRGEPIAELRPLTPDPSVPSRLLKPSVKGTVTLPTRQATSPFRPIRNRSASLSDAVREDRKDRF